MSSAPLHRYATVCSSLPCASQRMWYQLQFANLSPRDAARFYLSAPLSIQLDQDIIRSLLRLDSRLLARFNSILANLSERNASGTCHSLQGRFHDIDLNCMSVIRVAAEWRAGLRGDDDSYSEYIKQIQGSSFRGVVRTFNRLPASARRNVKVIQAALQINCDLADDDPELQDSFIFMLMAVAHGYCALKASDRLLHDSEYIKAAVVYDPRVLRAVAASTLQCLYGSPPKRCIVGLPTLPLP